jgi:NADH:ubiquinone oxidoreductase subunit E
MTQKIEVVICLGSSCFSRGNKNILKVISQFIKEKNISDRVNFHGGHCFGMCSEGPIIKVDNKLFTEVDEQKVMEILHNTFDI